MWLKKLKFRGSAKNKHPEHRLPLQAYHPCKMPTDWLLRIGDAENFWRSSVKKIWGINSETGFGKDFIAKAEENDRLWFVKSKSKGLLVAVATFKKFATREQGPLIHVSYTNNELGWTDEEGSKCDVEIHYTDFFNIASLDLQSCIKGAATIRRYNEKCLVDLASEYPLIKRYSQVLKN